MIQRAEAKDNTVIKHDFRSPKRINLVDAFKEKETPSGRRVDSIAVIGQITEKAHHYIQQISARRAFLLQSAQDFLEQSEEILNRIDPDGIRKETISWKDKILSVLGKKQILPLQEILVRAEETMQKLQSQIEEKKKYFEENPYSF